jgi:aspartokinase
VSERLARARINLVALFTSAALLSIVLVPEETRSGIAALDSLPSGSAVEVEGPIRVALVTAIGEGILDDLGSVPAETFDESYGFTATPRAVSLVIRETRARRALRALHRALVERRSS